MISIRMIKLCGDSIYKPLEMIFKFCLNQGIFPAETIPFQQVSSQKHLGLILETPLRFDEHIKAITSKVSKTIGLLRKLNNRLPRSSLTTVYKSFVRPHLDIVIRNRNIVWKQGPNWPFCTLMLRTKLYQNLFFFTGDQNVNKPKSRAARSVYGPYFYLFIRLLSAFFPFFCQDADKTRSNRGIIGYNLSKKHKLILYKIHRAESQTTQVISLSQLPDKIEKMYYSLFQEFICY